jgi:hypothetical protein
MIEALEPENTSIEIPDQPTDLKAKLKTALAWKERRTRGSE